MRMVVIPALLLICVGCSATIGHKLDASLLSQIKDGVTTKAQLVDLLGQPRTVTTESKDNTTIFMYSFAHANMHGSNAEIYTFIFGADDVLLRRITSTSNTTR